MRSGKQAEKQGSRKASRQESKQVSKRERREIIYYPKAEGIRVSLVKYERLLMQFIISTAMGREQTRMLPKVYALIHLHDIALYCTNMLQTNVQ